CVRRLGARWRWTEARRLGRRILCEWRSRGQRTENHSNGRTGGIADVLHGVSPASLREPHPTVREFYRESSLQPSGWAAGWQPGISMKLTLHDCQAAPAPGTAAALLGERAAFTHGVIAKARAHLVHGLFDLGAPRHGLIEHLVRVAYLRPE